MPTTILIVPAAIVILFVVIVALRPADFCYTRSVTIAALPAAVFPHVNELQKWQTIYPHRLFKHSLAMAFSNNHQFAEAHNIYTALQKEQPDFSEAFINDAILLYSQLHQPKQALALLNKTLKTSIATDEHQQILIKSHLAKIHLELKNDTNEVKILFSEAILQAKNPIEWLTFALDAYQKNNRLSVIASQNLNKKAVF